MTPELEKQISDRADELTLKMPIDNDYQVGYVQGFTAGHESGATEWAGRAQGLVLTLELINTWIDECVGHGKLLDADRAVNIIDTALAKYKEVGNG